MGVSVQFLEEREIHQIKLVYPHRSASVPRAINVYDTSKDGKRILLASSPHQWGEIVYELQKPVYRQNHHTIWLDQPTSVESIEIEISDPVREQAWDLKEVLFAN